MITVVIPVRNRAELVKRTLQSLAGQTRTPEAVILVNNGSTDNTLQVLQQWAGGRSGVTVITETGPGAARARNAGLKLVKTPYVLFFDSDDVMPPRHIEQISNALQCAGMPQIGAFDMTLIGIDGQKYPKPFRHGRPMENQIFHSILSTQRCVISTVLAREVGGWNEYLLGWDDWEFGIRLLSTGARPLYIPLDEPVQAYAQADSITGTNFSNKSGQWERALDACSAILKGTKYERLIDYRRAILAGHYRREGHAELAHGLSKGFRMKLIERYVAAGGRGVAYLASVLR